uniref:Iron-binding zinc finger CDGSH type domain-containing protein n=1 Tax=Mucochytrium quahogii TaxID=96639 RepID=A0A7S2W3Y3_9STRA|mmetsp:Transcript_27179/g.43682  ORF Transcript_27179/g.43682 Transcript_27179/m.43682 type:complete len:516 (-) Transcript_27179:37-1584(-)|eukprot:CAMPEP_0203756218 /NCGR_PEP_ID=MMETSP0098-20131031/9528_1 /ASSEMBLY_ACC=CAM_ASM_000208 /TAXON_ID=96639 /ORGANISM=" , Strain NY0313808BC1" /LENGTH=515 /DNA_ID=CAMNT_0050648003 /DNA_START=140 /DNA_END=1687 /DNA_ORIENTATION=+
MSKQAPKIAGLAPKAVKLEAGKDYYWCTCGLSKNQPFCDGSHRTVEGYAPQKFSVDEAKTGYMCLCKRTKNPPYCDGSHAKLGDSIPDMEDLVGGGKQDSSDLMNAGPTKEEPTLGMVKLLAREGLNIGEHGEMGAMGVPRPSLPQWEDIQIIVAQLSTQPLLDDVAVDTSVVIGPNAKKPLCLKVPLFVSDMSFGALSEEAKIALSKGAQGAGTGICSGEGGMLPEEKAANSRYLYEYASAGFGFHFELLEDCQAFHFKCGQGAKTGTGGHLPGHKVVGKVAQVRELKPGTSAVSPATFRDLHTIDDFKQFADKVRKVSGGIPIGFKLSANHIERDIDFAVAASADYVILDGRGGGTGAAPLIFRDNISVPTIPALARARRHLDKIGAKHVSLVATGGLRLPADFIKAMCLGADAIAVSNSALQAIGCVAARMCHTGLCPAAIATQDPELRKKFDIEKGAKQLTNFFKASAHLMSVMARACGHDKLSQFNMNDIGTWNKEMHELTGIPFAGASQ